MRKNIIFFYPSKITGGAEFLFGRLAKYLKENTDINTFYIDYKDGFIRNNPEFSCINYIDFEDGIKTDINVEGFLVTPISNIYRINNFINFNNSNTYLLFWLIHALNLIHVMPECKILEKHSPQVNKFILKNFCKNTFNVFDNLLTKCSLKESIYFMDNSCYLYNEKIFENSINEKYLPVPSIEKNKFANPEIIDKDEINITVLGRLCKEKTMPVLKILDEFNKLETSKIKHFHIIGDGNCKKLINPKHYKNVRITFAGTLIGDDLDNYLINKTDILFAMGTSCLEGAALKLPVILLPYSYSKITYNKYMFLFDSIKYNLGENIKFYKKHTKLTLSEIINMVYGKNKKSELGEKCYEYFIKNHSLKSTTKNLLEFLENDTLSINEYIKIIHESGKLKDKSFIYRILRGLRF